MMRDIYKNSLRVIISLKTPATSREIQELYPSALKLANILYEENGGPTFDIERLEYTYPHISLHGVSGIRLREKYMVEWTVLDDILRSTWFRRRWVVQELIMATKAAMWIGEGEIMADVILWLHARCKRDFALRLQGTREDSDLTRIASFYFRHKKSGPFTIGYTMGRLLGLETTYPIDQYFALAGISVGIPDDLVDYKYSFEYVSCVLGIICLDTPALPGTYRLGQLDNLARVANPRNCCLHLPSWIPDLTTRSPIALCEGRAFPSQNNAYASRSSERRVPLPQISWNPTKAHLISSRSFVSGLVRHSPESPPQHGHSQTGTKTEGLSKCHCRLGADSLLTGAVRNDNTREDI